MLKSVQDVDLRCLYHPYTSFRSPLPVYPVSRAEGVHLHLANGRAVVDGMSSWWAVIHGYNHPRLNLAVTDQLSRFAHVMFGGLTHEPAVELGRLLVELSPESLQKVFFSDSGSVAVEVAMKMALQFWIAKGEPRKRFMALAGGYHGDTWHTMSVCDPDNGMHEVFSGLIEPQVFVPRPACRFDGHFDESSVDELTRAFAEYGHGVAALILEPLVQGAGGMYFYHPEYLRRVRLLCEEYGVLLIADEIATGFGRTGKMFACEHAGISPDIMCVGKALTGGYMSLAATLCSDGVADTIAAGPAGGTFMHGPTFMANPLACAVAVASLGLVLEDREFRAVHALTAGLTDGLAPCRDHSSVLDVRVLGGIGVVEMASDVDVASAQRFFVERGAWIRPFGRLIYLMPPYVISGDELAVLTTAICEYVRAEV